MTNTDFIRFITEAYPEYKGRLLFGIGDLAVMFANGNTDKMRAHIHEHSIPHYAIGKKGHPVYNIYEVYESIYKNRWVRKEGRPSYL